MIMVPKSRSVLSVGVFVSRRLSRQEGRFRIAVAFRRHVGAVQVDHRLRLGMGSAVAVSVRAMQAMIDVETVACRQAIEPTNRHRLVSLNLYRRAGVTAVIAPHHGLAEVSM